MPTIGATTFVPAATGSARTPLGPSWKMDTEGGKSGQTQNWIPDILHFKLKFTKNKLKFMLKGDLFLDLLEALKVMRT